MAESWSPKITERMWIFPIGAKVDAIMPDGTHRYWSTHCRHDQHGSCSARRIVGDKEDGSGSAAIARKPAQCKTCAASCICPCHAPVASSEDTDGPVVEQ